MKKKHPLTHFGKVASLVMFVALAVSMLSIPAASPVIAQEPTPTDDGGATGQIVGGGPATPGEWPWQVALIGGSYIGTDYYQSQYCGGSLISAEWVLTAAHCVYYLNGTPYTPSEVDVVAGVYNLSSSAGSQRRDVTQIIVHPGYNNTTLVNDIALLELASPVTLGGSGANATAAVSLVPTNIGSLAGTSSWVTGWGNTESIPSYPEDLYEVQVPIITNTLCNQSYGGSITADMLCAGFAQGGKDSCQGDSGGPLVVFVDGLWQQAGIVSTGVGCADPGYYGIYTRVSSYTGWIDDYVQPDLAITSIDIESPDVDLDPNIYLNDDVFIYMNVQNLSGLTAGAFTVNVYVDGTPVACSNTNRDYFYDFTGLKGGASQTLRLRIPANSLSVAAHTIRVYVDSGCAITEESEDNNQMTGNFSVLAVPVAAPVHDNIGNAKSITNLPYTDTVDVRGATRHVSDPGDIACPAPDRILDPGLASVWYQYTPAATGSVYLNSQGSNYDTYIAVWQGAPGTTLVGCNDDSNGKLQSSLGVNLTGGITYYFEIAQYSNDTTNIMSAASLEKSSSTDVQSQAGGQLKFNVYSSVPIDVVIGGTTMGSYNLDPQTSVRPFYVGLDNGPVIVESLSGAPIVASERVAYFKPGTLIQTDYSEMMGIPLEQLETSYWFPVYDDVSRNTALSFGNVGNAPTTITIKVGGIVRGTYNLDPNQSIRPRLGINSGPVLVESSGGVPIIASERFAYSPDGGKTWPGFSEMNGMPASRLSTAYLFSWYNNVKLNTQLRFGNAGSTNANVTVTIGGVIRGTYNLPPNTDVRVAYNGVDSGPVLVESTNGVPIVASLRVAHIPSGSSTQTSYSEMMGIPLEELETAYWFPVYDDINRNTALSFGNVGNAPTTITITIGGIVRGSYNLNPSESIRPRLGVNGGPVLVESSGGVPIIVSERFAYSPNGGATWTSFSEFNGLPASQLSSAYIFSWYNNYKLNTQLRFGVP